MRIYDIIEKKRNGEKLSKEEIYFFIDGYVKGEIPDYQISALLMAIYFSGMDDEETAVLTEAMMHSGDIIDLSEFGEFTVDKHSTGGVGDKTSLVIAPVMASLGCKMAKMSGRGLGHTGGTVDKLESIPGFKTSVAPKEFFEQVRQTGVAVIGSTANLAPADKKLYALRDVTATVDSIPLIASSIMSKKLAAGAHNIVLDVKIGSGAFMKTEEQGRKLAEKMVSIGKSFNKNIAAVITNMDRPLGRAIGNALEIIEVCETLKGRGPADLTAECVELAANMIYLGERAENMKTARVLAKDAIESGAAFQKLCEMVEAQGGDADYLRDTSRFTLGQVQQDVLCPADGFITRADAEQIGRASVLLGAGRETKDSAIDFGAGIILHKNAGDAVKRGDVLATLYADGETRCEEAAPKLLQAFSFGAEPPKPEPLVLARVE